MAACAVYSDCHPRLGVPDEALDRHTIRGRRCGRGWPHFRRHAAHLERHEPTPEEEYWDRLGYDVIEGRAEVVNPPVPQTDQAAFRVASGINARRTRWTSTSARRRT